MIDPKGNKFSHGMAEGGGAMKRSAALNRWSLLRQLQPLVEPQPSQM